MRRGVPASGVLHDGARSYAIRILTLAASGLGEPLAELAYEIEEDSKYAGRLVEVDVARKAIAASLNAGTWREVRAEAAQKLREGWIPPGYRKG